MSNINKKKLNSHLRFNFFEIIWYYMCCQNYINKKVRDKFKLYFSSSSIVKENLDIKSIFKKFEDIYNLKILLFNPDHWSHYTICPSV
jgi:hypothetical protein